MKHLKTTLLAFTLLFSVNTLMAQENYDYATIWHEAANRQITVVKLDEEPELVKVDAKMKNYDSRAGLKKVKEMEGDGWELFDTEVLLAQGAVYVYFLRRKEQ